MGSGYYRRHRKILSTKTLRTKADCGCSLKTRMNFLIEKVGASRQPVLKFPGFRGRKAHAFRDEQNEVMSKSPNQFLL